MPFLKGKPKKQTIQQVLATTGETKNRYQRIQILANIALYLNGEIKTQVLQEALAAAHCISDEFNQLRALASLAPYLNDKTKTRVLKIGLATVRNVEEEFERSMVLSDLAPHLPDELKQQAFVLAHEFLEDRERIKVLTSLMPFLEGKLKDQTLAYMSEINYSNNDLLDNLFSFDERISTLRGVFVMSGQEALFRTGQVESYTLRNDSLKKILDKWKRIDYQGLKENLMYLIKFISHKNRKDGLKVVDVIAPALVHFCGPKIADELCCTMMDVTRWWP
jgi:hypothetical protein